MYNSDDSEFHRQFFEHTDKVLADIREIRPLIHCITNPISINDCANAVLALGGRPIMAEHPREVEEITNVSAALCLNMGNITDARMESIRLSAIKAYNRHIPFILDVVGITCSSMRRDYADRLLSLTVPTVIKGNLSEIKILANQKCDFVGIDSSETTDTEDELKSAVYTVSSLSRKLGCIIAASGERDIISDGRITAVIDNGSSALPLVTGTGCMLNVIIGTMLSKSYSHSCQTKNDAFYSAILGASILGICGEMAEVYNENMGLSYGLGTYHINLINALSTFTADDIKKGVRLRFF